MSAENKEKSGFLRPSDLKQMLSEDYSLRGGHSYNKKYRGNHRSDTSGVGIIAFFRNKWMPRFTGITNGAIKPGFSKYEHPDE